MLREHEIEIRVRYSETDAMGRLHHANFINYFELGRVELLRAGGRSYRQFEQSGLRLVVTQIDCRYFLPAAYDDLVRLRTTVVRARGARVEHEYQLFRGDELLARGHSTVACVTDEGTPRRLPDWLLVD